MTILERLSVLFEHHLACPDWGRREDGVLGPCRKEECPVCSSHVLLHDIAIALARLESAEKALRFVDAWMQTPAPPWPNEKEAENAYAVARVVQAALALKETPHER